MRKMKSLILIAPLIGLATAFPFSIIENEYGHQYYAVPKSRAKRQTKVGLTEDGGVISYTGTSYDNGNNPLDLTASAVRNFKYPGPKFDEVGGGRLDYTHQPSGLNTLIRADNTGGQTNWGATKDSAFISHTGNIYDSDNHRIDGTAFATKNFNTPGLMPDHIGGRLDYSHQPSGISTFIGADNMRGYGTDVNIGSKYNLYHNKNVDVDLTGQVGKHIGGPDGIPDPAGRVMITGKATW